LYADVDLLIAVVVVMFVLLSFKILGTISHFVVLARSKNDEVCFSFNLFYPYCRVINRQTL
jgi:hypothetical protein